MIRKTLTIVLSAFAITATAQQGTSLSDSAQASYNKGLEEKQKGRRMESLKHFEKAASYNSNDKAITSELADAYMDLRKYPQAWETYKKLEAMNGLTPESYKRMLDLSFNLRKFDEVPGYAAKLKKVDPSAKVNYFVGKVHYQQENYGEAIKVLNEAAKEEPTIGEIPYMIARSYADMQNYKQCIPYFKKAIELDTSKGNWVYELGLIYYAIHDDKNALQYIKMAGDKGYRRDNDYLENLGIAYLNSGNLQEGVKILNEILARRPSDLNILNMIAEAYYAKGQWQAAMDHWDKVLEYDKENAAALYMIGMCYQKKGEKAKGQQLCDKAIEMDPSLAALKQKKQMPGAL
ncbi:MAG: tetratricopeptide repeat protein [Chitinophagaceae bacterium]|nr:tetratricopeptide repeat protein [Chitinophagaceae bacterium]